jgi:hypothetical protein
LVADTRAFRSSTTETDPDTENSINKTDNEAVAKKLAIRQPFESALKYHSDHFSCSANTLD